MDNTRRIVIMGLVFSLIGAFFYVIGGLFLLKGELERS